MNIDNSVARVLELAQTFWQPGSPPKTLAPYVNSLGRALSALNTVFASEPNSDQDQKEWLIQLHTLMVFAYSQHNAAAAAAHYKTFVERVLYNHWNSLRNGQSDFRNRALRATDENPGIELITHEQPPRHGILTSALTVTSQFWGIASAEYRKAEKKYDALQ